MEKLTSKGKIVCMCLCMLSVMLAFLNAINVTSLEMWWILAPLWMPLVFGVITPMVVIQYVTDGGESPLVVLEVFGLIKQEDF